MSSPAKSNFGDRPAPFGSRINEFVTGLSPRSSKTRGREDIDSMRQQMSNVKITSSLTEEERQILHDPKSTRLARITQMYFLDRYFDLLNYVKARQVRYARLQAEVLPKLSQQEQLTQLKSYYGRERAQLRRRRTKMNCKDFDILTQVGQGGYGQVFLAKKQDTQEICALKILNKKLLVKLDETQHILTERDILTQASKSEWLVKLLYSFQDYDNLYLAMEFVPGGDFRTLLNNTGSLSARHARFYISEMFTALEALHQLSFIHRDLKPENFLITAEGHIKLTDFGLAAGQISPQRIDSLRRKLEKVKDLDVPYMSVKERRDVYRTARNEIDMANSIVGSPDYMALEVLQGRSYDYTIDYWSMGCMLFEALAGYPPFAGRTSDETYANLQNWKRALRRPQFESGEYVFSDRTWDLIQRLISSPRYRMRSYAEIIAHPYFTDVDFSQLKQQRPPFVPDLQGEDDAGYFDDFENEADMAKYKDVMSKWQSVENQVGRGELHSRDFVGFTFRHKRPQADYAIGSLRGPGGNKEDGAFATIL